MGILGSNWIETPEEQEANHSGMHIGISKGHTSFTNHQESVIKDNNGLKTIYRELLLRHAELTKVHIELQNKELVHEMTKIIVRVQQLLLDKV